MKKIIFNKSLHKIAIIAPSSSCNDARNKLKKAIDSLEQNGFSVIYQESIFSHNMLPYFAADTATRLAQLKEVLTDADIGIIWSFRGGYGASEIVFDSMDLQITDPKILIGFSDITILHFLMTQHYNLPSIHGPVITSLLDKQEAMLTEILSVLGGNEMNIPLTSLPILNNAIDHAKIEGEIAGGNLTLICNMIGTKLHPDFKGRIIVLEDVNEKGYQIHRHLTHMKNANLFDEARAVIFGDFTNSDEYLEETIGDFCIKHIPYLKAFRISGIGHGAVNHPIVLGGNAEIYEGKLIINSPFRLV
jgi:muramoyltetrapeptide carboxypeptidase LdcA involved in peptidoglycan recycling